LKKLKSDIDIAFVSTYPPSVGGIATFTEDIITTMDYTGAVNTHVVAITKEEGYTYSNKVIAKIRQKEREDYIEIARKLNQSRINLVVIEHKFGLYGGDQGEYILDLVNYLKIPIIATLHTILSEPTPKQKYIINVLGEKCEKLITMSHNTKEMLHTIYGVDEEKIEVIQHGVSKKEFQSKEVLKKKFGYENRQIISTIGLIKPGKGIEDGIEAIAKVVRGNITGELKGPEHKEVLYLILGQVSPSRKEEGAAYKNKLKDLITKYDLGKNIIFVNKYLSKDEIVQYLQLSDIYMTPYLTKDLAVSSVFAYAVGYGKAIVSTPFLYAKEMLTEGNGLFAEFNDPDSIAKCILQILDEPYKKIKMERNAMKIGRTMYWDKIAMQYTNVFLNIINAETEII